MLVASLGVAYLLSRQRPGVTAFRIIYYIPVLTSWVAASMIWKSMLSPEYGAVNNILAVFGIQGPGWLLDEAWAMPAIVLVSVWKDMGFFGLILLSGMVGINKSYYEAASLDGAGSWQKFWKITLPLMTPAIFYVLIVNATHNNFTIQQGFDPLPRGSFGVNFFNTTHDANVPILTGLRNSLIVSAACAALSVYFSALTAYAIYAYDFKLRKLAFTVILLIMTMPTQVSALGFLNLMDSMKLTNTLWPLILPSIAAPTVFFFMKQYMDSSLPRDIIDAARIDGSGEFHTFNTVILPILKPAMAVQAIFSFVGAWNNYFIPALIINDAKWKTVPILVAQLRSADFLKFDMGKVYMMITIAILPVMIVYLLLSKYIVRGVALGSVKG